MRRVLWAAVLSVAAVAAHAEALMPDAIPKMNNKDIEKNLPDSHPMIYIAYSIKLFQDAKGDLATRWYNIGMIRYQQHLLAHPEEKGDAAELENIKKGYGVALENWAGGNIRTWVQSFDQALSWDEKNPNNFTSKETFAAQLQQARADAQKQRDTIKRNEAQIRAERASKGLPDR